MKVFLALFSFFMSFTLQANAADVSSKSYRSMGGVWERSSCDYEINPYKGTAYQWAGLPEKIYVSIDQINTTRYNGVINPAMAKYYAMIVSVESSLPSYWNGNNIYYSDTSDLLVQSADGRTSKDVWRDPVFLGPAYRAKTIATFANNELNVRTIVSGSEVSKIEHNFTFNLMAINVLVISYSHSVTHPAQFAPKRTCRYRRAI